MRLRTTEIFNIAIFIQFDPDSLNLFFIFIQFNPRLFNSIPMVILFHTYSFNSIFRSIEFNFCISLIQFQYWFNLISVFIRFDFCIHSIQFVIHSIQFLYSFNPSLFIQSSHSFIQFGVWVKGENLSGELGLIVKTAEEMHEDEDSEVKSFFEHVGTLEYWT